MSTNPPPVKVPDKLRNDLAVRDYFVRQQVALYQLWNTVNGLTAPNPGAVNWGDVGGVLSNQSDLQVELDGKASTGSLAAKSDIGHTHTTDDIVSGQFGDTLISESSVVQYQALFTIDESQIEMQQLALLLDVEGSTSYVGEAGPGSTTSASVWRIKRLIEAMDGDITITWADGDANFDNVWDDHVSLTYS